MTNPVIGPNGTQLWVNDDRCWHRMDGPAYISPTGRQGWYIDGNVYIDNKSFQHAAKLTDEDMLMITLKYGNVK